MKLRQRLLCTGIVLMAFFSLPVISIHAEEEIPDEIEVMDESDNFRAEIEQHKGVPKSGDFAIGPTRFTYNLDTGEEIISEIEITNRIGEETEFEVGIEDFTAQEDPEKYTQFLGEEKSQFSSSEWFEPAVWKFKLKHGERIYLPVKISVPDDAEPGDHYSVVFVKTVPKTDTGIILSSRVGSLFFLTIGDDEINRDGVLVQPKTSQALYTGLPAVFEITFKNRGNVHLEPFGNIIVSNILGKTIEQIKIPQQVVLRESERSQRVEWNPDFAFGKYRATFQVERGYDDLTDVKTVTFWVIPVKILVYLFGGLLMFVIFIKFFVSKFEIRKK